MQKRLKRWDTGNVTKEIATLQFEPFGAEKKDAGGPKKLQGGNCTGKEEGAEANIPGYIRPARQKPKKSRMKKKQRG